MRLHRKVKHPMLVRCPPRKWSADMNKMLAACGLAALIVLTLATGASAQYYGAPEIYWYNAPPPAPAYRTYQYSAPQYGAPHVQYYSPPATYGVPYVQYYYMDDPVKRFWERQERYNRF
jgi:hypothetical protein